MRLEFLGIRIQADRLATIRDRRRLPPVRIPEKPTEEASNAFWSAFELGGTLVATCRCGRTHFCPSTTLDWEDGELEELLANMEKRPDLYVEHGDEDSVALIDGPSGQMLWGCPCHAAKPFENFLTNYRRQILSYFRRTQDALNQQAAIEQSELSAVKGELR